MHKRIIKTIALVALLAVSVGCGTEKKSESAKATIKIGVLSTADSLPLYVADQENLFTGNGCNVEVVEFGSASDQSKAMEAGELDGMMTDMVVQCLLKKGGVNLKAVTVALGSEVTEGKFYVASSSNSDVDEIGELEGSKIAVSEGTMMEFLVDSYCDELGIDKESIEKVNVPSLSLRYEMLMEGNDIDCAILPEPLADYAVKNGAKAVIDDTKLQNNYSTSVIVLNDELIKNQPEMVGNFMKAYTAAVQKLTSNPEEFKELALDVANVPEDMKESYETPHYTAGILPSEAAVERVVKWMLDKELLTEAYSYESLVSTDF